MIWWASLAGRRRDELAAIAELEEKSDWLRGVTWRVRDVQLVADFEIMHLGVPVAMTISYPTFFPDIPPVVSPREEVLLSGHQYGAGGELCLEFRPDNWEPEITGAMMIESAHRLLSGEQPAADERGEVESAHRADLAREVRSEKFRLLVDGETKTALNALAPMAVTEIAIEEGYYAQHWLAAVGRIGPKDAARWVKSKGVADSISREGYVIRVSDDAPPIAATYEFLESLFRSAGAAVVEQLIATSDREVPLLIVRREQLKLLSLQAGSGSRKPLNYRSVPLSDEGARLDPDYAALSARSVAIVGCGSVGSKIAVSLARSGVGTFVLVDGDLLLPGNLVRNELDLRAVGLNKPDALAARIREIRPDAVIESKRMRLDGQESAGSGDAALRRISRCDLIVDSTADPQIFNLCAAVARGDRKPLIWGEIYAGGVGGIVARARPELDPPPHLARRQIAAWYAEQPTPPPEANGTPYGAAASADAPPLIADDADVGVIAAHMTRFATDILVGGESAFPFSAYIVGMRTSWIFTSPFDTHPIALFPDGSWGHVPEENWAEELDAFIKQILPPSDDKADEA